MVDTRAARRYDLLSRAVRISDAHWQLVAQAAIAPTATVLEIGTGTGNVSLLVKRAAPTATVIGLDPDGDSLAAAARKAARAGVEIQLDQGGAGRLPYPDASIDRVLSSLMFHHLEGDERLATLVEVRRVLAPGGSLHVLDLTSGRPVPAGRLVHRLLSIGGRDHGGHGRQGHGAQRHGAQGHAGQGHAGQGHGHGHTGPDLIGLMEQAGLVDPVEVAQGPSAFGGLTFYRASAPGR